MGTVYSARQTSIDRLIALKMLKPSLVQNEETRSKFLAEAAVTGDIDHPNVVPVYDLGFGADGSLFYAMKRIDGQAWSAVIEDKTLSENLEILMRVCDAIACAHSRGVVHNDLKPHNVMLGSFGEVYVVDWGLAGSINERGKAIPVADSPIGGTPRFMSPEMARGEMDQVGVSSDVYLLGGMLFYIVSGDYPHPGNDVMTCLLNASENKLSETHADGELMDIALKALSSKPADRYESAKVFQSAIRIYQNHALSITSPNEVSLNYKMLKPMAIMSILRGLFIVSRKPLKPGPTTFQR